MAQIGQNTVQDLSENKVTLALLHTVGLKFNSLRKKQCCASLFSLV